MSVYAIFETTVVGAAVAAGAASALRTLAPGGFRRLFARRKDMTESKPAGCSDCGSCSGCGQSEAGSDSSAGLKDKLQPPRTPRKSTGD